MIYTFIEFELKDKMELRLPVGFKILGYIKNTLFYSCEQTTAYQRVFVQLQPQWDFIMECIYCVGTLTATQSLWVQRGDLE